MKIVHQLRINKYTATRSCGKFCWLSQSEVRYNNSNVVQKLAPFCIPCRVVASLLHGLLLNIASNFSPIHVYPRLKASVDLKIDIFFQISIFDIPRCITLSSLYCKKSREKRIYEGEAILWINYCHWKSYDTRRNGACLPLHRAISVTRNRIVCCEETQKIVSFFKSRRHRNGEP